MKKLTIFLFSLIIGLNTCLAANEELSKQAVAFYSDNNFDKTMDMLLRISEYDRTAQDWLLLGNLLDEKGQTEDAIYMYQKAIVKDPKFYKSYYNLANIYANQCKNVIAIENYKKAIKYNDKNPYIYYNLASLYISEHEYKLAKNELIKAVTLKNDIPEIHYNLAYVYQKLNKPKLAQTYLDNYNKLVPEEY